MKHIFVGEYNYEDLKNAALSSDASQENIDALGEWFEQYGDCYWNGEYFEIDSNHRLFRVLKYDEEYDVFNVTGYEIR